MEPTHEVLRDLHRRMVRIRRFEEAAGRLSEAGKLPGFLHLYVGEEAVAAGVCCAKADDPQSHLGPPGVRRRPRGRVHQLRQAAAGGPR